MQTGKKPKKHFFQYTKFGNYIPCHFHSVSSAKRDTMLQNRHNPLIAGFLLLAAIMAVAVAGVALERRDLPTTPTVASRFTETAPCEDPSQTTGYPDYDAFCKCRPYAPDSPAFGNPHLGLISCDTKCSPANPTQTLVRPENDSLSSCMNACTGSFEKVKLARGARLDARQEDYWFCHGVNFIQGELCEFFGSIGSREFVGGGGDCWYLDGLDG
ncbi:hypothetical protein F4779DRAFT_599055 [Xylariaceae sp. FL0662B]|nr:hypothetical protein F4779DRAFT_599055 [Xylariaceae sp. FL0662B]